MEKLTSFSVHIHNGRLYNLQEILTGKDISDRPAKHKPAPKEAAPKKAAVKKAAPKKAAADTKSVHK